MVALAMISLNAGGGNDSYIYNRGDGNDIITEARGNGTGDKLVFTDINAGNVSLSYVATDLTITIAESAPGAVDGGAVKLVGTLINDLGQGIDSIVFADGTTWNAATIRQQAIQAVQTSGNDTIVGFNSTETYTGGHGNDVINGGNGDDTYVYARSDGNNIITEARGNGTGDKLVFTDINAGNVSLSYVATDLTITIAESAPGAVDGGAVKLVGTLINDLGQGIDSIVFADGTTWNAATIRQQAIEAIQTGGNDTIVGFNSTETFVGGHGNDVINGGNGNDTYIYARSDGNDVIAEARGNGTGDKLVFADINADNIVLVRNGTDLTITIAESTPGAGDGGSVKLVGTLIEDLGQGVDSIVFANGATWNRSQMATNVAYVAGTTANETITGTTGSDIIMAGFGNDTLVGLGQRRVRIRDWLPRCHQ
jgi:Ca2+-binding RTX toxin-like protein